MERLVEKQNWKRIKNKYLANVDLVKRMLLLTTLLKKARWGNRWHGKELVPLRWG